MPPKAKSKPTGGRQSTLSSYFKLPVGTPPAVKQQTTLRRQMTRINTDSPESEPELAKEQQDEVMGDVEEVMIGAKTQKRSRSPSPARVKDEESDVEPPKKRGRPAPKSKKSKSPALDQDAADGKQTEVSSDDDVKPKKRGSKPKKTRAPEEAEQAASEDDVPTKRQPRAKKAKADEDKPKKAKVARKKSATAVDEKDIHAKPASGSEGEAEVEAESDSELKKPAVTEKARKDIQTTLTSKSKHPYPDWKEGAPVPYAALVKTFTLLEATTKRLEKLSISSLFLRQVLRLTPDDLLLVIHLMINKLAADYEGIELGIGESLLIKAISESCGRGLSAIKEDQKEIGDLGEVAMKSRSKQGVLFQPKPLTVQSVHKELKNIATTQGTGGQGRKVSVIQKLLSAAKGEEAKYIVRGLEGKLRIGLADKNVIVALSQAVIVHESTSKGENVPSLDKMTKAEVLLKTVYSELPNYDIILPAMLKDGIMKLPETCKLQPGVPLKPMLAKPTKSISEVLDRFDEKRFTCEYKYDGERVQIHYVAPNSSVSYPSIPASGTAKIFSRNSEELSPKYPDILGALGSWVKPGTESFVLDCEAVAWDMEQERVLPFQQLMTRKRKDVKVEDVKVKVCVFAFDLLFLNGESQVRRTLTDRRDALHEAFTPVKGAFAFATYTDGQTADVIQTFLDASIKASCEGLMVKMLDTSESHYEPSKRSRNWLKVKKDYLLGAGDSLDLVVIGAYHGKGKRTAVYGAFLLACYNPSTQEFESVCNIGTGFSEEVLTSVHEQLEPFEIERPKKFYRHADATKPDVWFEPRVVWEVKTADLSLSPKYCAAKGVVEDREGKGRGVSLRFPRYVRGREDKEPESATTSGMVAEMYRKQEVVGGQSKGGVDEGFEY